MHTNPATTHTHRARQGSGRRLVALSASANTPRSRSAPTGRGDHLADRAIRSICTGWRSRPSPPGLTTSAPPPLVASCR